MSVAAMTCEASKPAVTCVCVRVRVCVCVSGCAQAREYTSATTG